jgi:hypothetical protein
MQPILRNILAIIAGFLVGSALNMAIIAVGPIVIPPPDGVDMSDIDKFSENLNLLRPANFLAPWLAHALLEQRSHNRQGFKAKESLNNYCPDFYLRIWMNALIQ